MAGKTVVVTGATGFIASTLVRDLLERGYTVRGTVRSPDNISKVGFLLAFPGAKERLTLHKADLLDVGSFDSVVDGADGVFHTASPFFTKNITDPQKQFIDPAVKGTRNLLEAVAKATSVKRVVLTSSNAAVAYNSAPRTASTVFDESSWTDAEYAKSTNNWYVASKALAERAAWDFVKGKHFQLVVVNPVYVVGTMLQPSINASNEILLDYLTGELKQYNNGVMSLVDVQDVSLGHILAYEKPEAEGRYILCEEVYHHRQITERLHKLYPNYPVPTEPAYEPSEELPIYRLNNSKSLKLGVKYRSFESQLIDTVTSLQEKGFLKAAQTS